MHVLCLILGSWFWAFTGATYATTISDIEVTQHCLHANLCREGNPLMPTDRKKLYPIQMGITTGVNALGYSMKKKGYKRWWIPQVALITAHSVGTGVGLKFIW